MLKFSSLFSLLLFPLFAAIVLADDGSCPGGYSNGAEITEGTYWYQCENGQRQPKGCISPSGDKIPIDGTFTKQDYQMQCVRGSDGFLTLVYKGCSVNGQPKDIGSTWQDGVVIYTCVKDGNNVVISPSGCVDQGTPAKLDDRVAKGDYVYECRKGSDGKPIMNKVGCNYQGQNYNIGQTFSGPTVWYACTDHGPDPVGCMHGSQQMKDGDNFKQGGVGYACKVTSNGADFVAFACIDDGDTANIVDRKVGCFWEEGDFEYTCKDIGGNKVAKVKSRCIYHGSEGKFSVNPGCAQPLPSGAAVGCVDNGGSLTIQTFSSADSSGLGRC